MENQLPQVYVVHCIDTEGPLYQSLESIFELVNEKFNLDLEASLEQLQKLQEGLIDTPQREAIQTFLDPHLINSHGSWTEIDLMLQKITLDEFRMQFSDSF